MANEFYRQKYIEELLCNGSVISQAVADKNFVFDLTNVLPSVRVANVVYEVFKMLLNNKNVSAGFFQNVNYSFSLLRYIEHSHQALYKEAFNLLLDLLTSEYFAIATETNWNIYANIDQILHDNKHFITEQVLVSSQAAALAAIQHYETINASYNQQPRLGLLYTFYFYVPIMSAYFNHSNDYSVVEYNIPVMRRVLEVINKYPERTCIYEKLSAYISIFTTMLFKTTSLEDIEKIIDMLEEFYHSEFMATIVFYLTKSDIPNGKELLQKCFNYAKQHNKMADFISILNRNIKTLYLIKNDMYWECMKHIINGYSLTEGYPARESLTKEIKEILRYHSEVQDTQCYLPRYISMVSEAENVDQELFVGHLMTSLFRRNAIDNVEWLVKFLVSLLPAAVSVNGANHCLDAAWRRLLFYVLLRHKTEKQLFGFWCDIFSQLSAQQKEYLLRNADIADFHYPGENVAFEIAAWKLVVLLDILGYEQQAKNIWQRTTPKSISQPMLKELEDFMCEVYDRYGTIPEKSIKNIVDMINNKREEDELYQFFKEVGVIE